MPSPTALPGASAARAPLDYETPHHGLIPLLHKPFADPLVRFTLYEAPTSREVERSAHLIAATHGFSGAYDRRPLLADADPQRIAGLPPDFGGHRLARSRRPLPDSLNRIAHHDGRAPPTPPTKPAAPSPPRTPFGLSPRPTPLPWGSRRALEDPADLFDPPARTQPLDRSHVTHAAPTDGDPDARAHTDLAAATPAASTPTRAPRPRPFTGHRSPPAPGRTDPAAPEDEGAPHPADAPTHPSDAHDLALSSAARTQAIRMFTEFLSHFPYLRAHLYPGDEEAPADACRALPLPALAAAAEAISNQWFGLLAAMNTAALSKTGTLSSSILNAEQLASLAAFDAAATRQLRDGTISTPPPTNFERSVNFLRVGQIALDMTLALFVSGCSAITDRLHDAADRVVLTHPDGNPNRLAFDTFTHFADTFRRTRTARVPFDCGRVLRRLSHAVIALQHSTLIINDSHVGAYATGVRTLFHQRSSDQTPATPEIVLGLIHDIEDFEIALVNLAAADSAVFGTPETSHFTLPEPQDDTGEEDNSDLTHQIHDLNARLEAHNATAQQPAAASATPPPPAQRTNAHTNKPAQPAAAPVSPTRSNRTAPATAPTTAPTSGATAPTSGAAPPSTFATNTPLPKTPPLAKCWGPGCLRTSYAHWAFCYGCRNVNPALWICRTCLNENLPAHATCRTLSCKGDQRDGRPVDTKKDAARIALIKRSTPKTYVQDRPGLPHNTAAAFTTRGPTPTKPDTSSPAGPLSHVFAEIFATLPPPLHAAEASHHLRTLAHLASTCGTPDVPATRASLDDIARGFHADVRPSHTLLHSPPVATSLLIATHLAPPRPGVIRLNAMVVAFDTPLILSEGLLKSEHDLHLVTFDRSDIREFLSHPASNATYTVHRNADRAPYVNLLPTTSPDGHPTLSLGHAAVPGRPFIRALIDNCSSTTVISQATAAHAASPTPGPPMPILTATGTGSSLGSAILDIVLLDPHASTPTRHATYLATPNAGATGTGGKGKGKGGKGKGTHETLADRPPRTTSFGRITDPATAALRLGITSDSQLQLAALHLHGLDIGSKPTIDGATACNALRAAATRRPIRRTRITTTHIGTPRKLAPCVEWDFDWSAPLLPDAQGNCFLAKFFCRLTGLPFFSAHPSKSTADLIRAIDALHVFVAQLDVRDTRGDPAHITRIHLDHDPSASVPGRQVHDRNTSEIQAYLATRHGLAIMSHAPYSPELSGAEPHIRRVHALVYLAAINMSLRIEECWRILFIGATLQYALAVIEIDGTWATRYTHATGRIFDATTILGAPGQFAFILNPGRDVLAGRPKATAALYGGPELAGGMQITLNLQSMRLSSSRDVYVIPDSKARPITLALTSAARPSGALVQPEQDHFDTRLRSLMHDYSDTTPEQMATTIYSADPLTGMPTAVTRYVPTMDEHGAITLAPEPIDPAVAPPGATAPTSARQTTFSPAPAHAIQRGPKVSTEFGAWLLHLDPSVAIHIPPNARGLTKPDGTDNPSSFRRLEWTSATTIGALGHLTGTRRADVFFDVARGLVLFDDAALATFPAPAIAYTTTTHQPRPFAPDLARAPPWQAAAIGASSDRTLAYCAGLGTLEDNPHAPDPYYPPYAAEEFAPYAQTPTNILAAQLLDLNTDPFAFDREAFAPPRIAAVFSLSGGPATAQVSSPRSVREAEAAHDYATGWRASIQSEVNRNIECFEISVVPFIHYHITAKEYGADRVSIGNFVVAFKVKTQPDGSPMDDPEATRKTRITIADAKGNSGAIIDTYSGCAHTASDNVITQLQQELRGDGPNEETHVFVIDVSGAYGKAKAAVEHLRRDPKTGVITGRALYARVPPWMAKYGPFPTHDSQGRPNLIIIPSAMPGRRESGRWWEIVYHRFLKRWGFIQGVWDLCCFHIVRNGALLIIIIHVDDTRGLATHKWLMLEFLAAWRAEFNEEADASECVDNFTGLSHIRKGDRTEVTCQKVSANLAAILVPHPFPAGMTFSSPLGSDAMRRLEEEASDKNPLVLAKLDDGRRILGTGAFITGHTYPTASFAFGTLARYVNERKITKNVWHELLRFGYHLVSVAKVPLVFTRIGPDARIEAWADSSMASPESHCRSPGGYLIRLGHPDGRSSAPLTVSSQLPRKVMTATGGAELEQLARATKAVIGLRMLFRELKQPQLVLGATPLFSDASAALDGTHCRRVSRESKWVCINLALIRQALEDGVVTTVKCPSENNIADVLTKPLTGPTFTRAQRALQGLPPA